MQEIYVVTEYCFSEIVYSISEMYLNEKESTKKTWKAGAIKT